MNILFLDEISTLEGISVNGSGEKLSAILNLLVQGVNNVDLLYKLDLKGACIAVGSACASASVKPSHVLLAMGLTEADARECVRISFGKENTEETGYDSSKVVETLKFLRLNTFEELKLYSDQHPVYLQTSDDENFFSLGEVYVEEKPVAVF